MSSTCDLSTICTTDPSQCQTRLSSHQLGALVAVQLMALLVAVLVPCIDANTEGYFKGPPNIVDSGGYIPLFIMLFAVSTLYYTMIVLPDLPCNSAVGACNTISCVSANFIWQGYVFMFCTLALGTFAAIRQLGNEMQPPYFACTPKPTPTYLMVLALKYLATFGGAAMCWTGIFPYSEARDFYMPVSAFNLFHQFHGAGLGLGFASLVFVPYVWFMCTRESRDIRWRPAIARTIFFVACVIYLGFFIAVAQDRYLTADSVSNYCAQQLTESACNAWPCGYGNASTGNIGSASTDMAMMLSVSYAQQLGDAAAPGFLTEPPTYTCSWVVTEIPELVRNYSTPAYLAANAGACLKDKCQLFGNSLVIIFEFGILFLMFFYAFGYGIPDLCVISQYVLGVESVPTHGTTEDGDTGTAEIELADTAA